MKVHNIRLRNFRLHPDTSINPPLEGVIGIVGQNESGKSTIGEAMAWALYGSEAYRDTKDTIRWFGAASNETAQVELVFEVGGIIYKIIRDEDDAQIFEGAEILAEGTSAVNDYVPGIVGMTYSEFAASYLVLQKDLDRISSMKPATRQAFIRELLGIDRIDEALASLRERKNELRNERLGLEAGLGERTPLVKVLDGVGAELRAANQYYADTLADLTTQQAEEEAAKAAVAEWKTLHDQHVTLVRDQKDLDRIIGSTQTRLEKSDREIAKALAAKEVLAAAQSELDRLPALRDERDLLKSAEQGRARQATLQNEVTSTEARLNEYRAELAKLDLQAVDEEAIKALEAERQKAEAEFRVLTQTHARMSASVVVAKEQIEKLAQQAQKLEELGEGGECPTCMRAMGEAYETVMASIREETASLRGRIDNAWSHLDNAAAKREVAERAGRLLGEQLAALQTKKDRAAVQQGQAKRLAVDIEEAQARIADRRAELDGLPAVHLGSDDLAGVEAQIARLEELHRSLDEKRGLLARLDDLKVEHDELTDELFKAQEDWDEANECIEGLAFDEEAYSAAVDKCIVAEADHATARAAHSRADSAVMVAKQIEFRARSDLADYDERAVALHELVALHQLHEKADARLAAFRVAAASAVRPELEELMSGFVSLLSEGRTEAVELTDSFETIAYQNGRATKVLSGGAEDIMALAMRLAISQMISERAGQPISLLFIDEPFGSQDEVRRGAMLALVRKLKTTFEQVFLISHVAETRDMVDHVIELEFDTGAWCSRVRDAA